MEQKRGIFARFLDVIERVGNKLPDPFVLFVGLAFFMILLSWVFSLADASVQHPGTGEELAIRNLMSGEGLQFILTSMLENFTGFAPLGLVLAMMLGIGLAEKVGLLDYAIRKTILKSPPFLLTYTVVFVGIMGNLASDAAVVLIPPLGALVFYKVGRHPLAGLAAGFAGAGAGFTANLFIAGTDALLAGITTEAVAVIDDSIVVTPIDNWYFNIVSVFVLTVVGGLLTSKFIEPRLGKYKGDAVEEESTEELPRAKMGFFAALIAGLLYWALIFTVIMLPDSPLRGEGGTIIPSPFIDGIVPLILIFFVIIGLAFGIVTGTVRSGKDVADHMTEAIKELAGYIVLVFAIAQFIAYFNWSNLGTWIAVNGAEFLQSVNFTGIPLIIGYIIFTGAMNFLITSGSAKWAIEAPIFVPMFMQLGYDPAFTQVAYRVADSSFNIVTPLFPYLVIILAFMKRYDKNASLGTYISLMLPYSIAFIVAWIILIMVFYYAGLPYGPGVYTFLEDRAQ
ncbi:AbgT family transporter [Salinicoccus sp. ID82-1]|uniref:AbgT family transporter n=1 Tax=Salinicoccus sp. ID82-1 TaxID=2820269 RepID=UPI001F027052|nr:AbgT family transporter [Salinicoccus sp. ID82-1]MCG1009664.1 AbgT family transporter [Salinicoccus sp. ID82-1]